MRDTSHEAMVPFRARIIMECVIRALAAPVGPVDIRCDNPADFRGSTISLRDRGFAGRACIHPSQVTIANDVLSVDREELDRARAIVDEFDARSAEGQGVYSGSDGAMVDLATVRWARAIVSQAHDDPGAP